MRSKLLIALPLLFAGGMAQAQDPHVGFALTLGFPTGEFRSKDYPALSASPVPDRTSSAQNEGYDLGVGGQFTISFPVDPMLAIRLNLSGMTTSGSNIARSDPFYGDKINLQHSIFSVGGDLQFFLNGSANRHRGTYLLGGVSADFERFDRSYGDPNTSDFTSTERKNRMGGNFGIGHSFGLAGNRFTFEATYHKTLSGNDASNLEPPSTDFLRLSLGWVF